MGKSKGMRRKSRSTLSKRVREKGRIPLSRLLTEYGLGDKVVIDINSGVHKGMPHKRFQGRVANIVEKRGKAYVLEIPHKRKSKFIISTPHHIKKHQEVEKCP